MIRLTRTLRLIAHVSVAMWLIFTRLKHSDEKEWAEVVHHWSIKLLKIFNFRVVIRGNAPEGLQPAHTLIVCNHVSWLDIFAIFTMQVPRFVAKQEVARWPIAGRITRSARSIFIDRSNRRDSSRVNQEMADSLENGACIAVFPESTTSDGRGLLPFKAALFQSALMSKSTVQPMSLCYLDRHGYFTTEMAYYDEMTIWTSLWQILSMPTGIIELTYGNPIQVTEEMKEMSRYELSDLARKEIESCMNPVFDGETKMEIQACVQHRTLLPDD